CPIARATTVSPIVRARASALCADKTIPLSREAARAIRGGLSRGSDSKQNRETLPEPPADLFRKALVELRRVGLFRGLPHPLVELVGVVADENAPALGLDAVEDDLRRSRRRGRRLFEKVAGTVERDL